MKGVLAEAQDYLRRGSPPVKWVALDAMHLTLQFLGETDAALLPQMGAALRTALAGHPPLTLTLATPGAFPKPQRASVLWVGVGGATLALARVQAAVAAALAPLGFPPETRPFHPHLTLGRVRREATVAQQQELGRRLGALPALPPISWEVTHVVVFQSHLSRAGPRYMICDSVSLGSLTW